MPRIFLWPLALSVALTCAGCSRPAAPAAPPTKTVDRMVVSLTATPPAHTGDNTFIITLSDAATQAPIGNANVTVTPQMLSPKLPGTSSSGRAQGNGVYNVPVRLGIATRYNIALHIERPGQPATDVTFPVEAVQ